MNSQPVPDGLKLLRNPVERNGKVEILIAENNPNEAELARLLEQHGFLVTTASNGREALALLDRCKPTLVISDVLMPELDGHGLCKAIKATEKWKHILVMLVTTLSDAQDVVRGLECGADSFIRKPYDDKTLLSRIDYLLINLELRRNQTTQMGVEINLGGQTHFISSEREQILNLLISTYEQAIGINDELKAREKELAHSNQFLSGLYRIAEGLNQANSEREVAEIAVERALQLPGVEAGWISLREGDSGFRLAAARNLPAALEVPGAMDGDCACRSRLLSGALDSATNILECERLQKATGDTRGLRYHASVPLWLGDRTLGVMNLVGPEKGLFKQDELQVLHGVGNQLAVALERARLREHLETLVEERTARINRLNRIYAVLSGINTTIVRVGERQQLFEKACRIAVEQGKFAFAWIGMLDAGTRKVTPVAKAGRDDGYLSLINLIAVEDTPGNWELIARMLAGAAPLVCHDIASDERMKTWRAEALKRGYRSVAVFPLFLDGQPIGVFALYSPEPHFFDEEEIALLVEMAGDISFALDHLRKEELLEQQTTALTGEIAERKGIEQALRHTEKQYRQIVEQTQEGILTYDVGNRITFVNPRLADLLDYSTEEMVGRSIFDVIDPSATRELESRLSRRRSGLSDDYDLQLHRRGGTSVWTRVTASPLRDASGNYAGGLVMITDTTERRQAEERLRASEERFRALVENSLDGIILLDPDSKILYASPAVTAILGYEVDEVVGLNPFSLIHPDDLRSARERFEATLKESTKPILSEFRVRHKDGTWRSLEFLRSNRLDDPSVHAIVLNYRDVTESRQSRDALDQLRRRYELILSCAAEGILGLDIEGRVVFANPSAEAMFGWSAEEFVNIDAHRQIHHTKPDGTLYPSAECPINLMLSDGKTRGVNNEFFWRRNGEQFAVEYTCAPIYSGTTIIGGVVTVKDVSEQKQLQRRLEQVQRIDSLGRVAATIAHEFNNVLMGIKPFAEVIGRRAGHDHLISKAAEQISTSVRRGKRVTDDILRFTKPNEPQLEVTDMTRWIAAIEPELRSVAGSAVQLSVQVPPEQLFTRCDAAQLQQVVTNLVINARDAMPGGGAVTVTLATCTREDNLFIRLSKHQRFAQLTVRDTGKGIPPELLEKVFEPLFTTKRLGTGLGLAVARQVVTQNDGFIFAENDPGGGAAFHILLPQVNEAPLSTAVAVVAQKTIGRIRRLLLVEDEVSVAAGLSTLLELEKIVVRVVDQGREVLRAIEEFHPDAVVLDLTLPDIDGREVFAQVTARWPHLPVVFSTGHGGEADLASQLARDHVGFLRKPYDVEALIASVEKVL